MIRERESKRDNENAVDKSIYRIQNGDRASNLGRTDEQRGFGSSSPLK